MKTAIVARKHLFPFRTQKLSWLRPVYSLPTEANHGCCLRHTPFIPHIILFGMNKLSRAHVQKRIEEHFAQQNLDPIVTKKIKKLAMGRNLKLGKLRARFCKKCYADLVGSKIRVTKEYKLVTCKNCNFLNRIKI